MLNYFLGGLGITLIIIAIVGLIRWFSNRSENNFTLEGNLRRKREGKSYYVIDPIDDAKIFVNSTDDMYEDAKGGVWKLVD